MKILQTTWWTQPYCLMIKGGLYPSSSLKMTFVTRFDCVDIKMLTLLVSRHNQYEIRIYRKFKVGFPILLFKVVKTLTLPCVKLMYTHISVNLAWHTHTRKFKRARSSLNPLTTKLSPKKPFLTVKSIFLAVMTLNGLTFA